MGTSTSSYKVLQSHSDELNLDLIMIFRAVDLLSTDCVKWPAKVWFLFVVIQEAQHVAADLLINHFLPVALVVLVNETIKWSAFHLWLHFCHFGKKCGLHHVRDYVHIVFLVLV